MKMIWMIVLWTVAIAGILAAEPEPDPPNYITDEEFAQVRDLSIPMGDMSELHTCTEEYDDDDDGRIGPRPGFSPRLWPNGRVPYIMERNVTIQNRQQVAIAMMAYHNSTCIRFIRRQFYHRSWVSISFDPSWGCGRAHVGMLGGQQRATFGGSGECKIPVSAVMVHELGHTIGMGHEQARLDRDDWVDWNTRKCTPESKNDRTHRRGLHKLYDYLSSMHYQSLCSSGCLIPKEPGVTVCGSGGPLAVLDVEVVNEVYGCTSGCMGYRFVNQNRRPLHNLLRTGTSATGGSLYTCRAYHQGHIIPGKYYRDRETCFVGWGDRQYRKTGDNIEVLTDPNHTNFRWVRGGGDLPRNAVPGGRTRDREKMYVVRCLFAGSINSPGFYLESRGQAYTSSNGINGRCPVFEFLTCS